MDGLKKRLRESVQFKLSFWLSCAIVVIAIIAGVFSFVSALNEAHDLQDDFLYQVAALFDQEHLPHPHLGDEGRMNNSSEESRLVVQYLPDENARPNDAMTQTQKNHSGEMLLPFPAALPEGLQTIELMGEPYRVLIKTIGTKGRIAVAQEIDVRDDIAQSSALRTVMPFLILVPILLGVVANLVRKMFRPIASLAAEIDRRGEQELHPVEENPLPLEVRPFVIAINHLLHRVAQAMTTQRHFISDAAHELRSPLTALSLQAERLAQAPMSDSAQERLVILRLGIERSRNLLNQLLTLARTQSAPSSPLEPVSVQQVYRRVLEDLMPLAEAKHIDIGVESSAPAGTRDVRVLVNETDLITLIKNLVDNAIRYTPPGGRIDLLVEAHREAQPHQVILQIRDSGPGIPPLEYERFFDSFYRVLGNDEAGSGLGLSIVKAITDRIGAEVQLAYADEINRSGLCVTVRIPVVGEDQA